METIKSDDLVLDVEHLTTKLNVSEGELTVLEDVNLSIKLGEIVVVVGESGSGKSMTINSILQLIPKNLLNNYTGIVKIDGKDILSASTGRERKKIKGDKVSLIAQNAMTSLDPSYKVGKQIVEIMLANIHCTRAEAKAETIELLQRMGIDNPERVFHSYPHQLSGGLRQRVIIAMALACKPKLIIADEPTSALDPTIQLQVLDLLKEVNRNLNTAILMITHDFGVVSYMADRVVVMYAGQVVESGAAQEVIYRPQHPYTISLLKCIPNLKWIYSNTNNETSLFNIPGEVPNLLQIPAGCRFAPRCYKAVNQCFKTKPLLKKVNLPEPEKLELIDHYSRCIFVKGDNNNE